MRYGVLGAEEHTLHVHRLHAVPFGFGYFVRRLVHAGNAGVVHQHVQRAEMVGCLVYCRLHVDLAGNIDVPVTSRLAAGRNRVQFLDQLGAVVIQDVEHRNTRAFGRQAQRAGASDTQGPASDYADFAFRTVHGGVSPSGNGWIRRP